MNKNIYQNMMEQAVPGANLIQTTKSRMSAGITAEAPAILKRRLAKAVLITAALAAVLLASAFVFGDAIQQFFFGESSIARYDQLENSGARVIGGMFLDSDYCHLSKYKGPTKLNTLDELAEVAEFEVKAPVFLPENAKLEAITGLRFTEEEKIYAASISYHFAYVTENSYAGHGITLTQYYKTSLRIDTVHPIQKVTVGGNEASAVLKTGSWGDDNITLYWMMGDNVYELSCSGLDLDAVIAVAESLETVTPPAT